MLVETRLPDGRWTGHGEDHVLVAATPKRAIQPDLENAILTVRRTAIDGELAERVTGEIVSIEPAPRVLRASLPVLAGATAASMPNGGAHAR